MATSLTKEIEREDRQEDVFYILPNRKIVLQEAREIVYKILEGKRQKAINEGDDNYWHYIQGRNELIDELKEEI